MPQRTMDRRSWMKATGLAALGAGLSACAVPRSRSRLVRPERSFVIPNISWDRIIRTSVGLRPYRPSGWRVEAERYGEKIVIHNYGHGSEGVGMSWGTAHLAMEEAHKTGHTRFAVVGCGAVGLATARLLQRQGFEVTIYAKDLPPHTTSNHAIATFDPQPAPGDRDVEVGRISHRYFQDLVGDYYGVRWLEHYEDESEGLRREREQNGLRDLNYYEILPPREHPFGPFDVVRSTTINIQPQIYLNALMRDFRLAGGEIVVRDFPNLEAFLTLSEPVIMNCTGLGAKALFNDAELVPVKGQYMILLPQPDVDYSGFDMTPRDDGLLVGNSAERGVWTLEPNVELRRLRMNRAIEFWGSLKTG